MKIITVNIRKPLFNNYVYINGNTLDRAINQGAKVEITIPNGKAIVDPLVWKNTGKIMKKVFKIPGCPMTLYGNFVNVPIKEKGIILNKKVVIFPEQGSLKL